MRPVNHTGQAFGLLFRDSRPLPELQAADDRLAGANTAIDIDWLEPVSLAAPIGPAGATFQYAQGVFELRVAGVGLYGVTAYRITITPEPGADERQLRLVLFGSAVGALLCLRGLTVLHGSAVALPDGSAAVFCGLSTAGKSTLAAALAGRGHPTLADDIAAVRFDAAGQAWCLPGLARAKLWRDALDTLGLSYLTSATTRVMPQFDKHSLPLTTAAAALPLRRCYELQASDDAGQLHFQAVTGMDKVTLLLSHGYRPAFVLAMGEQAALLRSAAALARQLSVERITRPRQQATLSAIVARLEAQWAL